MSTLNLTIDHKATREETLAYIAQRLPNQERRGRSSGQDHLKKLGALRLLRRFDDWQEALEYAGEHKTENGNAPIYQHQEQWCRARVEADKASKTALDRLI